MPLQATLANRAVPVATVRAHLLIRQDSVRQVSCLALAKRIGVDWARLLPALGILAKDRAIELDTSRAIHRPVRWALDAIEDALQHMCQEASRLRGPAIQPAPEPRSANVEPVLRQDMDELEEGLRTWLEANPVDLVGPRTLIELRQPNYRERRTAVLRDAPHLAFLGGPEILDILSAIVVSDPSKMPVKPAKMATVLAPGHGNGLSAPGQALTPRITEAFHRLEAAGDIYLDKEMGAMPRTVDILPSRALLFWWAYQDADRAMWKVASAHASGRHAECCAIEPAPFLVPWSATPAGDGPTRQEVERIFDLEKPTFRKLVQELADAQVLLPIAPRDSMSRLRLQRNLPLAVLQGLAAEGGSLPRATARRVARRAASTELDAVLGTANLPNRGPIEDQLLDQMVGLSMTERVDEGGGQADDRLRISAYGWHALGLCPGCGQALEGSVVIVKRSDFPLRGGIQLPLRHPSCGPWITASNDGHTFPPDVALPACERCGQELWWNQPVTIRDLWARHAQMEGVSEGAGRHRFNNMVLDAIQAVNDVAVSIGAVAGAAQLRSQVRSALVDLESINLLSPTDVARFEGAFEALHRVRPGTRAAMTEGERQRAAEALADLVRYARSVSTLPPDGEFRFSIEGGHAIHARCSDMSTSATRGRGGPIAPV